MRCNVCYVGGSHCVGWPGKRGSENPANEKRAIGPGSLHECRCRFKFLQKRYSNFGIKPKESRIQILAAPWMVVDSRRNGSYKVQEMPFPIIGAPGWSCLRPTHSEPQEDVRMKISYSGSLEFTATRDILLCRCGRSRLCDP